MAGAAKNIGLLAFGPLFYAWGEPVCVWLMVGSSAFNRAFGCLIRCKPGEALKSSSSSNSISNFTQPDPGPIGRRADIGEAVLDRCITISGFAQGFPLFCMGLGKKALPANMEAMP